MKNFARIVQSTSTMAAALVEAEWCKSCQYNQRGTCLYYRNDGADGTPRADKVLNPAELPEGWPNGLYMDVCLAMIRAADLVVFLPGWERSRGASLEMQYSRYEGKPVYKIAEEELEAWMEG